MGNLSGKVAFITGAGSGIGKAAALELAKAGAKVAALSRDEEEIAHVVNEIRSAGGEAMPVVADVSSVEEMKAAVEKVVGQWQRMDIVFANAGINGVWAPLDEITPEDWDKTIDINLKGTFLTIKYALPYLKKEGGSVIITSSVNGNRMFSNTGASVYATSKAGQVAFGKMIALELAKYKIRVNSICPGAIKTEIRQSTERSESLEKEQVPVVFPKGEVPLTEGKPGRSEQVAKLVLFLASDESDHISGTEIYIDGAQSLLQG